MIEIGNIIYAKWDGAKCKIVGIDGDYVNYKCLDYFHDRIYTDKKSTILKTFLPKPKNDL